MTNGVSYGCSVESAKNGTLQSGILDVVVQRELSHMSVSLSVRDSDGEFLLIEAADSLPSWVTPSAVENRVRNLFELPPSQAA
jgi:hypothetical protein